MHLLERRDNYSNGWWVCVVVLTIMTVMSMCEYVLWVLYMVCACVCACRCRGCNVTPIEGSRFHCQVCANFDFCHGCFNKGQAHNHAFERFDDHGQTAVYVGTPCSQKKALKSVHALVLKVCTVCFYFHHFLFLFNFSPSSSPSSSSSSSPFSSPSSFPFSSPSSSSPFSSLPFSSPSSLLYYHYHFCRRKKKKIRGGSVVMEWDQIVRRISVSSSEDSTYRLMDGNQTTCWQSSGAQGKASGSATPIVMGGGGRELE